MLRKLSSLFLLSLLLAACSPKPCGEVVVVNLATIEPIALIRTPERDIEIPDHPIYGQKGVVKLSPGVYRALTVMTGDYSPVERVENVYIEAGGVYTWYVGAQGSYLLHYHPGLPCPGEYDLARGYFVPEPIERVKSDIEGRLQATGLKPLGLEFVEMGPKRTFVFIAYRTTGGNPLVWPIGELVSELYVCDGVEEGKLIERGWLKVREGSFIGGKAEALLQGKKLIATYQY